MKVVHRRGRPHQAFSRTQDAVFLFNALRRRGYTWARALELIERGCGVSARNVEAYVANNNLRAADVATEDNLARMAIIKHGWDQGIRKANHDFPKLFPLPDNLLPRN